MDADLHPDAGWRLEWCESEFDYFRRACAADGNTLPTTLSYVTKWWRRIATAEGEVAAEAKKSEPWIPLRGPMFVPDPRGGPGCIRDM